MSTKSTGTHGAGTGAATGSIGSGPAPSVRPNGRRGFGFSGTFFWIEVGRMARNGYTLAFTIVMPVVMYVIFGATPEYGKIDIGNGNVSFSVMVSMAAYGVATSMTSLTSLAATEAQQGWGRQLALTPSGLRGYASVKICVALFYSALSLGAVFLTGVLTGAAGDTPAVWLSTALITLGVGLIYGLFGLGVGLIFPSDAASGLAAMTLTLFAFFGNVFMPLAGVMLDIAHYTPLYGYVALARWPLSEGYLSDGSLDPLWGLLLNVAAWTAVFVALVMVGLRRSRGRH